MAETISSRVGRAFAKLLHIDLGVTPPVVTDETGTYSYYEHEPTVGDWLRGHMPTTPLVRRYIWGLFPFLHWIGYYNVQWLIGDLVAGITVGAVVIPQGMAYAELAKLPPEYGLYSSFMGVLIYWFFATSKDITIGPVAVMSTLIGSIIIRVQAVHPEIPPPVLASALAIICGVIVSFLGLLRLGFIVDFIPLPAITAFMTGSAINVCAGQVKTVLGEKAHFSTRGATYKIIIDTLKHLPSAQMDAAMGLTALAMLYGIRSACNYGTKKKPHKAKLFFFLSTLRTAFVVLLYTMISAAVNLHRRNNPAFKLLGNVPRGFKAAGVPKIDVPIIKAFVSELPVAVIVLLIEHIAISKSFGRVNNYTIDPSQEFIAIGISNLLGPFLGAYPATGSFSRTAIKAKCGVRTPLAGVVTAIVVLLAIYALPALFFFIPKSSLSAVIIHAVGDLVTPPRITYQFWRVSPIDALIFLMGVIVIIFSTIETGIYCTISVSLAVLLFRLARARGQFLGYIQVHSVVGDHILNASKGDSNTEFGDGTGMPRRIYLPTEHEGGTNPRIKIHQPAPGVFIYRVSEGFNYPNANHYTDHLVSHIFKETRRTNSQAWETTGDRPWNDPGPTRAERKVLMAEEAPTSPLPTLRAIILDFAAVNNVDVTSVQNLIDVRNQLDRWASPDSVQWHFAHIHNRWTKRALAAAGFGFPAISDRSGPRCQRSVFNVAESLDGGLSGSIDQCRVVGASSSVMGVSEDDIQVVQAAETDAKVNTHRRRGRSGISTGMAVVDGINRPFFHVDLTTTSALKSALADS
ncbi:Sulfate permease [Penicillium chrysogenum]|uniref:Sulfate permease n=1 Tax=Penicillium chrysogenum TaxID=5076 RepID=A0A167UPM9_PENCH|nr:sulfate permease SutA-Penicillium chrysogenum [Penicillium rubens]KAJ5828352.1 sulfate permease SutA-Penicillium chrysogenum [Penicillium rubens]KZN89488.1 Sulfate permease [Penicillium chrysogenum]